MGIIKDTMIEINKINDNQTHTEKINNKLWIIGGSAGGGKVNEVTAKYSVSRIFNGRDVITLSDILEDFAFEDGKPVFRESSLVQAMANGDTVLFDECDYFSDKVLDFIETITKEDEIDLQEWGVTKIQGKVKIAPNFRVIAVFTTPSRWL